MPDEFGTTKMDMFLLDILSNISTPDLSGYATKDELNAVNCYVQQNMNDIKHLAVTLATVTEWKESHASWAVTHNKEWNEFKDKVYQRLTNLESVSEANTRDIAKREIVVNDLKYRIDTLNNRLRDVERDISDVKSTVNTLRYDFDNNVNVTKEKHQGLQDMDEILKEASCELANINRDWCNSNKGYCNYVWPHLIHFPLNCNW
jgi:chromosome segregation ATPase